MPVTRLAFPTCLLLGLALGGCSTDDFTDAAVNDALTPPADRAVADTALTDAPVADRSAPDVSTGTDAADVAVGPEASVMDGAVTGAMVTLAQLANPAAAMHPANRSVVTVTDSLVALSPRLFISQSATTMKCLFAAWVGTSAGGDFSAIEVTESLPPPAAGSDCFAATEVGNIPANLAIGDTLGPVGGEYQSYCPSGTSCPPGVSAELEVSAGFHGAFSVTGHGGAVPIPAMVNAVDVTGMGATAPPRGLALQNGLVRLTAAVLRTAPSTANHNVMLVSTGAATPTMAIDVSKYPGVGCQRTALAALAAGATVGNITGVLEFSFGQWVLQPRQSADLPGVVCADAGAPTDAGAHD